MFVGICGASFLLCSIIMPALRWVITTLYLFIAKRVCGDRRPLPRNMHMHMRGGNVPQRIGRMDLSLDPNTLPTIEDLEDYVTEAMLDEVLNQIIGTNDGIIIHPYHPARHWLWNQWRITVFYRTFPTALRNMTATFFFCVFLRQLTHGDWKVWVFPNPQNLRIARLVRIQIIWNNLRMLTTIILTYFVGQAYSFWKTVHDIGRAIQIRINDISFLLATHANRKKNGTYTRDAQLFLEEVASLLRIYHLLFWATQATRFRILLTNKGLARMVTRGIMSIHEKETMEMQLGVSKTERQNVFLAWMLYKCHQARQKGTLEGGAGLEHSILGKTCALKSLSMQISHKISCRMPLAYTHFVQILVDSFLFSAPLAQ